MPKALRRIFEVDIGPPVDSGGLTETQDPKLQARDWLSVHIDELGTDELRRKQANLSHRLTGVRVKLRPADDGRLHEGATSKKPD